MKNHILFLALLCPITLLSQPNVSLEQMLDYAFPSGLVASERSDKIVWVQNKEGIRNIWYAEGPGFQGRRITSYSEDDGQGISSLLFTPDEEGVIYVRGGSPNRQGEFPNPTSDPDGAKSQIVKVDFEGGDPEVLTGGYAPVLTPDGEYVLFQRESSKIYRIPLEGGDSEQLLEIRGSGNSLTWSPDGSKLAFVSKRGDHGFVGIYDPADETIEYLHPSIDNDGSPVWSPDGSKLAFMRVPNEKQVLPFTPRRSGLPWSIWLHDLESGQTQQVWQAAEGAGSVFRFVSASNQLLWGSNDRIVFPYEGDGWTHLYSVPASGGDAKLLTPGDFEVQFVALSPDGGEVVYSSNQNDIDRQHLWRVPVSGGEPEQLTSGNTIEWSPRRLPSGALAFIGSGPTRPAQVVVLQNRQRIIPDPAGIEGYPSETLVEPRQVVFSAADGMQIHGQLFMPEGAGGGDNRPGVLFFHGGSRRQMLLGFHHRGYYHNAYAMNQYLAAQGYVVLSVNYRSGIGYGMEFREALNYGAQGASEFQDVLGAGLYLQSLPEVDPQKIGLWGGSYGGYLTALGLARASDLFAAGVDLHGVHDWNVVIRNFVPDYNPNAREELARRAYESSPMADIKTWESPVLMIHGDDDRNVPFSETVDLGESLRRQDVPFEQLIFPDEVHGFLLHRNWLAAYRATADFFGRKLAGDRE